MTLEEIRALAQSSASAKTAAVRARAAAPAAQADTPVTSPLLQHMQQEAVDEAGKSFAAEVDLNRPPPAPTPDLAAPGGVPPGQLASQADDVDWNPDVAEKLGMGDLAEALRSRKGTAQTFERGPITAENLVQFPMQKAFGRFGSNPDLIEQELTYANINKMLRRKGQRNLFALPQAEQDQIRAIAADGAKRKVASIIGMQEQRGNVLVDLDPEETVDDIRRGATAMGVLTGQYVGAKVEGFVRGIDEEETLYARALSPFTAMFVAGGRSVQPQGERPIIGMQKESKLSWFLRLAPSTAVGSWLFDKDMGWSDWGSEEHIKKIYAEGYDITQEVHNFGEAYARATPWTDSETAKKIAGFGMVAPIIFLEPDATAALMMPVGKLVGGAMKAAKPSKLIVETVLEPELKRWMRLLDEAQDAEGIVDLGRLERQINVGENTAAGTMWRAAKGELYARALAEGVPVWNAKSSRDLSYIEEVYQATRKARDAAGEGFVEAATGARGAKKTQEMFGRELSESVAARAAAAGVQVDTARLAKTIEALDESRYSLGATIGGIIESKDIRLGQLIGSGGERAAKEIERLVSQRELYEGYLKDARLPVRTDFSQIQKVQEASMKAHRYRSSLVSKLPDMGILSAVRQYKTYNDAIRSSIKMVEEIVGRKLGDIPGDLGDMMRAAAAKTAEADAVLARNADAFVRATGDVKPAAAAMDEAALAYFSARKSDLTARNLGPNLSKILKRYAQGAAATSKALREGTSETAVFKYKGSVIESFVDGDNAVDAIAFQAKLMERYGASAVEAAVKLTPDLGPVLSGGTQVGVSNVHLLSKLESAAFGIGERGRVAAMAPIQAVLESTARLPNWGRSFSREAFLTSTLKLAHTMTRITDPILSRGLGAAPKLIRDVYRRTFERFQSLEMEMNSAVAAAVAAGKNPIEAAMGYLVKGDTVRVADSVSVSNKDVLRPAEKALNYLRAVAKAGDDAWGNDLAVRAMSWSALPSGQRAEEGAAAGLVALRKLVESDVNPEQFLKRVADSVEAAVKSKELKADAREVTSRFVLRGTIWAATQHDAMWDMLRAQGGGVSTAAANTLDFMTDQTMARKLAGGGDQAVDDMFRISSTYNLPLTQEVLTGAANSAKTFFGGVARKNELMRVAEVDGMGVYIPGHIRMAMDEIPRRLVKELEQYGQPENPITRGISKALRTWRISVVNGWVLPRPAHFVNTFVGDMSQLVATVGWRPAARISSQTAIAYIPFVGTKLQDTLAEASRGRSIISGLTNPELSRVMNASVDVIETADGPLTSRRLLMEAREDGMLDSISTGDLMEVTRRTTHSRWAEVLKFDRPMPWIEKSAKYLEAVQHRIRVQTYLEARTGKLTGKALSRNEAAAVTREALFDWRLGVPRWESETVGRLFVFHAYKRNMLRQLGAALTESVTTPSSEYLYKALSGRTRLNRMRQSGQLLSAVPEAIYWTDPETSLEEDEQIREFGRRIAPWWVDAEQVIMNREIDGARKAWYSEVAGRDVTTESLILPALTTLDALSFLSMTANTSMATAIMLGEGVGMRSNLTTGDVATIWEQAVDNVADSAAPGAGGLINNMLRPIFGESQRKSVRGQSIPQNTAAMLNRLGWAEYVGTYEDKSGKLRYHADPGALKMVARLVASNPISDELARNWTSVANPGMQSSLTEGTLEAMARITGIVRYSAHNPLESADWETVSRDNKLQSAVKGARSQSGER